MKVEVRVIPGAGKRALRRDAQGIVIKLVSRAQEGKANRELVEYIADLFSLKKNDVQIVAGAKGRKKILALPIEEGALEKVLEAQA